MGLFKILLGPFGLGLPIRPLTGQERARKYQRETNELLGDLVAAQGRPVVEASGDTRQRVACPECAELILAAARVCRFCGVSIAHEEVAPTAQSPFLAKQSADTARSQETMRDNRNLSLTPDEYHGTFELQELASFCGVPLHTLNRWVVDGRLPAPSETNFKVKHQDVLNFIRENPGEFNRWVKWRGRKLIGLLWRPPSEPRRLNKIRSGRPTAQMQHKAYWILVELERVYCHATGKDSLGTRYWWQVSESRPVTSTLEAAGVKANSFVERHPALIRRGFNGFMAALITYAVWVFFHEHHSLGAQIAIAIAAQMAWRIMWLLVCIYDRRWRAKQGLPPSIMY